MGYNDKGHKHGQATHDRIKQAFAAMRKRGYVARMAFSCCGGCGSHEIASGFTEKARAGKPVPPGAVYYSQQSRNDAVEDGRVWVNFGGSDGAEGVEDGGASLPVAYALVEEAHDAGLCVVWDGSEGTSVLLTAPDMARQYAVNETSEKLFAELTDEICEALGIDDETDPEGERRSSACAAARIFIEDATRRVFERFNEEIEKFGRVSSYVSIGALPGARLLAALLGHSFMSSLHTPVEKELREAVANAFQLYPDWPTCQHADEKRRGDGWNRCDRAAAHGSDYCAHHERLHREEQAAS